jgi:hypothetical protein
MMISVELVLSLTFWSGIFELSFVAEANTECSVSKIQTSPSESDFSIKSVHGVW